MQSSAHLSPPRKKQCCCIKRQTYMFLNHRCMDRWKINHKLILLWRNIVSCCKAEDGQEKVFFYINILHEIKCVDVNDSLVLEVVPHTLLTQLWYFFFTFFWWHSYACQQCACCMVDVRSLFIIINILLLYFHSHSMLPGPSKNIFKVLVRFV